MGIEPMYNGNEPLVEPLQLNLRYLKDTNDDTTRTAAPPPVLEINKILFAHLRVFFINFTEPAMN